MKQAILLLAALLCSCTPTTSTTATQVAQVVEYICIPVVSAAAPAEEPLCVLGDELANAVIAYIQSHAGTAPSVATTAGKTVVAHDLYDALAQRPGVKGRAATKRCPVCPVCPPAGSSAAPPGKVAP